jgi:hypothetical protein
MHRQLLGAEAQRLEAGSRHCSHGGAGFFSPSGGTFASLAGVEFIADRCNVD